MLFVIFHTLYNIFINCWFFVQEVRPCRALGTVPRLQGAAAGGGGGSHRREEVEATSCFPYSARVDKLHKGPERLTNRVNYASLI